MRSTFLKGLAFGVWLCACGADLNPQPEPPGGNPTTGGVGTGSTGSPGSASSTSSTTGSLVTGSTSTGAGGATGGTGGAGGSGGAGGVGDRDASSDATGDGASDAKVDGRDGGNALDAEGGVAQSCAFAATLDRRCGGDGDCTVGVHQTDCCGNTTAIGMNRTERARFDMAEPVCKMSYPLCGCPSGPTRTDSGEVATDATTIRVGCITSGPMKECRTYVTMRPPDTP